MNEFKVNTFYKNDGCTFQMLMNELFLNFIKNNIDATCSDYNKELIYYRWFCYNKRRNNE